MIGKGLPSNAPRTFLTPLLLLPGSFCRRPKRKRFLPMLAFAGASFWQVQRANSRRKFFRKIDDDPTTDPYHLQRTRTSPSRVACRLVLVRAMLQRRLPRPVSTPHNRASLPNQALAVRRDCRPAQDGVRGVVEADFGLPPQFDVLPPVSSIPWPRRVGQSSLANLPRRPSAYSRADLSFPLLTLPAAISLDPDS